MLTGQDRFDFIKTIRHECTNYDKLSSFYHYYRDKRSELNSTISKLLDHHIDIDEFKKQVESIESFVNLRDKNNRKRYLDEEFNRLKNLWCYSSLPDRDIKKVAKSSLAKMLKSKPKKEIF